MLILTLNYVTMASLQNLPCLGYFLQCLEEPRSDCVHSTSEVIKDVAGTVQAILQPFVYSSFFIRTDTSRPLIDSPPPSCVGSWRYICIDPSPPSRSGSSGEGIIFFRYVWERKHGVLLDESGGLMKDLTIREKTAGGVLKGQAGQVGRRQGQDEWHMGQARFIVQIRVYCRKGITTLWGWRAGRTKLCKTGATLEVGSQLFLASFRIQFLILW